MLFIRTANKSGKRVREYADQSHTNHPLGIFFVAQFLTSPVKNVVLIVMLLTPPSHARLTAVISIFLYTTLIVVPIFTRVDRTINQATIDCIITIVPDVVSRPI